MGFMVSSINVGGADENKYLLATIVQFVLVLVDYVFHKLCL